MTAFWRNPLFWGFIMLLITIPLVSLLIAPYLNFKKSAPPVSITETQSLIPTPVPTIVPGSCLILEGQFCSQAEVIDWTNPSGKKMRVIGFNLPAGVPLFMPIDGQVTKAKLPEGGAIKGFKATVFDPSGQNSFRYNFYGDLGFENMFSLNKKTSEAFGFTQQTGIENAGNYNVIFAIEQGSGREATIVEDELRKMFPETNF